jgi:hypothetical protein
MRRLLTVFVVLAVMAAMVAVMAAPAFAAARNPNANVIGQNASDLNQAGKESKEDNLQPGLGGLIFSKIAQETEGELGQIASNR